MGMLCLAEFDPSGTKDGNVAGRLQGFVKKVLVRSGYSSRGAPTLMSPVPVAQYAQRPAPAAAPQRRRTQIETVEASATIPDFIERCGLDESSTLFLEGLEEDVLTKVLTEFDPSGTKD